MRRGCTAAKEPTRSCCCMLACEGLPLGYDPEAPGTAAEVPGRSAVFAAVSEVMATLLGMPASASLRRTLGPFTLNGYWLGPYGGLICVFPSHDGAAAYRCYARGLAHLTRNRLRLVPAHQFADYLPDQPPVLFSPVDLPILATDLRRRFRQLVSGLMPKRQAVVAELALGELIANTAIYGQHGRVAVYLDDHHLYILAQDDGPGISLEALPESLLVKGYSTRVGGMGMGYPTVLEVAEHLIMATGSGGTWSLVCLLIGEETEDKQPCKSI